MKIKVRNFKRCERADLEGGPLVLLAGPNGNGKSSILTGVALAATRAPVPADRNKGEAGTLVLRGQDEATVQVEDAGGLVRASYPRAEIYTDGTPPKMSAIAAGLVSIADMRPSEVSQELGRYIDAMPTKEDLVLAMKDALDASEKAVDPVWDAIEKAGWDEAHNKARTRGTKLKGEWEGLTKSKRWGSEIGDKYLPEGWDDLRHPTMSVESAEESVKEAEEELERAIAEQAVDGAVLERLTNEAKNLDAMRTKRDDAQKALQAAQQAFDDAKKARDEIPLEQGESSEMPCPHCGGLLRLNRGNGVTTLDKSERAKHTDAELKELRMRVASADGVLANRRGDLNNAKSAAEAASVNLAIAERAAKELAEIKSKAGTGSKDDVEKARSNLDDAKLDLATVRLAADARKIHKAIMNNLELVGILAPNGLRTKVLNRSLDAFNEKHLAALTKLSGFPAVEIHPDMGARFGGMQFRDLGESHRWIARVVLQLAIAKLDGSSFVIIDRADVCDLSNKNKLFQMLAKAGVPALVGMTANKPDLVADLEKMKLGQSYWIRDGVTKTRAEALAG